MNTDIGFIDVRKTDYRLIVQNFDNSLSDSFNEKMISLNNDVLKMSVIKLFQSGIVYQVRCPKNWMLFMLLLQLDISGQIKLS